MQDHSSLQLCLTKLMVIQRTGLWVPQSLQHK
jgi:hypothetical protein